MKRCFKSKRWIAFFLAVLLIVTTCINSSDVFLLAAEDNRITEPELPVSSPAEEKAVMEVKEETGPVEVTDEADTEESETEETDSGLQQSPVKETEQETDQGEVQEPVKEEVPKEEAAEEISETVEGAVTYNYAVYYYYDGTEDEDARVEGTGAFGDPIFTSAANETVHNGKSYVLDHVENEDGKIGEDAGGNVVKVYYKSTAAPEAAMAEQTITATGDVAASVAGVMPEGTVVEAVSADMSEDAQDAIRMVLEAEGLQGTEIKAVDITLKKDGKAVQPGGDVTVKLSNIFAGDSPGNDVKVYHISGDSADEVKNAKLTDSTDVEFRTNHFSVYAAVKVVDGTIKQLDEEIPVKKTYTKRVDDEAFILESTTDGWNHTFEVVKGKEYISLETTASGGSVNGAKVTPKAVGEARVKHSWKTEISKEHEEYFVIIVTNDCTISFELNGGTGATPEAITSKSGDLIVLPDGKGISREGYELLGWAKVRDASGVISGSQPTIYALGTDYAVSGNQTLYAVWANKAVEQPGIIKIAIRKDGIVPDEPSIQNANYDFLAGPDDRSGIQAINVLDYFSPAHTVSGSSEVKANLKDAFYEYVNKKNNGNKYWDSSKQYVEWYVIKYQDGQGADHCWHIDGVVRDKSKVNLTYDRNGATEGLAPDGAQYNQGEFAEIKQGSLERGGYNFVGWNTKADGSGETYQAGDKIKMTGHITLYAKWEPKNTTKYKVEYYLQNLDGTDYELVESKEQTGTTGTKVTAEKKVYKGFKYNEESVSEGIIKDDGTLVLKLYYDRNADYTVTYDLNGGMLDESAENRMFSELKYGQETPKLNGNPVRDGYSFNEWEPVIEDTVTDSVTYVAKWTADEAQIVFIANGGSSVEGMVGKTGQEITDNEMPTTIRDGYLFSGWYINADLTGNKVEKLPEKYPAGTTTYYAAWIVRNDLQYKINYHYSDANNKETAVVENEYNVAVFGTKIDYDRPLSTLYDGSTYVYVKTEFVNDDPETQGIVTTDNEKNVIDVYYALDDSGPNGQPDQIPDSIEYHVTYLGNGGETKIGEDQVVDPAIYPVDAEKGKFYVWDNMFIKENAEFAGWRRQDNGEFYDVNDLTDETTALMTEGGVTFEAQWKMLSISKELADASKNKTFELGERIDFVIKVTNSGDVTLNDVTITDTLTDAVIDKVDGIDVEGQGNSTVIAEMESGDMSTVEAHYIVREEIIGDENFKNKVTATTGTLSAIAETGTIPMAGIAKLLDVNKTVTNLDEATKTDENGNKVFALGDTVKFDITVRNGGNQSLWGITIEDELNDAKIVSGDGYIKHPWDNNKAIILYLAPNSEPVTVKAEYVIGESDLGNSDFRNTATATSGEVSDSGTTPDLIPVDERDPKVSVVKTVTSSPDSETGMYKVGDTITYQIAVTNEGNVALKNVEVKDTMSGAGGRIPATSVSGAKYNGSTLTDQGREYSFTITEIPRGETRNITYSYRITKDDIGKTIRNAATVENIPEEKVSNPDPVVIENRKLEVTKTITTKPANGSAYGLGETIRFEIIVKNAGNVDLERVKLTDTMIGAAGNATVGTGSNTLTIGDLAAGAERSYVFSYIVKEDDLKLPGRADAVKNTATAVASDDTTGYGETEYIKIGEQNPDFTVAKTITNEGKAEDGKYAVSDTISYEIIVTNTGNTTLRNIVIKDIMTGTAGEISNVAGAAWNERMGSFIVNDPIAVDASAHITYDYVIQPEDAGKTIRNTAIGKFGSDVVTEAVVENKELSVMKYAANRPANGTAYVMGEEVLFGVTVRNTGNVSLSDIRITDQMQNAAGEATAVNIGAAGEVAQEESGHTIEHLAPGEYTTVYYSYIIQEEDIGKTDIRNMAMAESEDGTVDSDETRDLSIDGQHTLTVHYVYAANGMTAAASYTAQLPAGKEYMVYSPVIQGYNSSTAFVAGTMPEEDIEFIVYYSASAPAPAPGGGGGGGDTPTPPAPPAPPAGPEQTVLPDIPVPAGVIPGAIPVAVAADPALAAIDDEAVPLQGALIDVDEDGNVTITPISEEEVPLAGGENDEHKCCILHFLLMLAALIVYTWYTYSMKKRRKELAELKDRLAEETLKRHSGR